MVSLNEFLTRLVSEVRTYNEIIQRDAAETDERFLELSISLSRLLELGETCPDSYIEFDGEPPDINLNGLRKSLTKTFPSFSYYYVVVPDKDEIFAADAINDLVDIYSDLNNSVWYIEAGAPELCAWYAKLLFNHWGEHALNLKRYLHKRIYDW